MKKWMFIFILLPSFLTAQEKTIVYDEMAEERKLPAFTELSVEGGINVYLSPFGKQAVAVSAREAGFRDLIVTEVEGGRLRIRMGTRKGSSRGDMRLKVYVSVPRLEKIIANGASDIFVNGILKGDELQIQLNGASDFAGAVDVEKLRIQQTGASDSRLSGRVNQLQVQLSGASDMKSYGCAVNDLEAMVSGASRLEVNVNRELTVTASGASDVFYKGKGVVKKLTSTGASTIRAVISTDQ